MFIVRNRNYVGRFDGIMFFKLVFLVGGMNLRRRCFFILSDINFILFFRKGLVLKGGKY